MNRREDVREEIAEKIGGWNLFDTDGNQEEEWELDFEQAADYLSTHRGVYLILNGEGRTFRELEDMTSLSETPVRKAIREFENENLINWDNSTSPKTIELSEPLRELREAYKQLLIDLNKVGDIEGSTPFFDILRTPKRRGILLHYSGVEEQDSAYVADEDKTRPMQNRGLLEESDSETSTSEYTITEYAEPIIEFYHTVEDISV